MRLLRETSNRRGHPNLIAIPPDTGPIKNTDFGQLGCALSDVYHTDFLDTASDVASLLSGHVRVAVQTFGNPVDLVRKLPGGRRPIQPIWLFMRGGKVLEERTGYLSRDEILECVKRTEGTSEEDKIQKE